MTQLVTPPPSRDLVALRQFIEAEPIQKRLLEILPPELTPARYTTQVLTLCNGNPLLLQCTHQSIFAGLIQAAELQLELSTPLGQAYLVPRKIKGVWTATFQVGYRGLMALAYRSGKVSTFHLRKVYRNEPFEVEYAPYPRISHRPIIDGDRGDLYAYYCLVNVVDGGKDFEVLSKRSAEEHRDRYGAAQDYGPWKTAFDEMALKTCARRVCKRLPFATRANVAALLDEYHEAGVVGSADLPVNASQHTDELARLLQDPAKDPPAEGG